MKSFFTPKEVQTLLRSMGLKFSYRQVQYFDKTRFISPSYRRRGKYRLYTFADIAVLNVALVLRYRHNVSIQRLRPVIKSLRPLLAKLDRPLSEVTAVFDGSAVLLFDGAVFALDEARYVRVAFRGLRDQIGNLFYDEERAAHSGDAQEVRA